MGKTLRPRAHTQRATTSGGSRKCCHEINQHLGSVARVGERGKVEAMQSDTDMLADLCGAAVESEGGTGEAARLMGVLGGGPRGTDRLQPSGSPPKSRGRAAAALLRAHTQRRKNAVTEAPRCLAAAHTRRRGNSARSTLRNRAAVSPPRQIFAALWIEIRINLRE